MKEPREAYKLTLSDGTSWCFHAAPEVVPWLDALAKIMRLQPCDRETQYRVQFVPRPHESGRPLPGGSSGGTPAADSGWANFDVGAVFRVRARERGAVIVAELTEEFIDHPEIKYIDMWSAVRVLQLHAVRQGGGPLHAALAERDGAGILIAAAGNTGKSTCCRRLPEPWKSLCDDQVLTLKQAGKESYRVHPLPTWSDYLWRDSKNTWPCADAVPLRAAFFLEQAAEDKVVSLPASVAAAKLFQSAKELWEVHWPRIEEQARRAQSEQVFLNALEMAKTVPAFRLHATIDGCFWEAIEQVL